MKVLSNSVLSLFKNVYGESICSNVFQYFGAYHLILGAHSPSVNFVEKVYKLLEIDFVIGLNTCYFYHSVYFVICYLLAKNRKYFL